MNRIKWRNAAVIFGGAAALISLPLLMRYLHGPPPFPGEYLLALGLAGGYVAGLQVVIFMLNMGWLENR